MAYQSFEDQKGDSNSSEKLAKLRFPSEMNGKSFLDLGCNEGFFCLEAVRRGAKRALGIDADAKVLEKAKVRAQGKPIEYQCGSWWDLPDEKFDVIQMSSALHYEKRPRELAKLISERLKPGGLFILEAGVYSRSGERIWVEVQRHDGSLLFPTRRMLVEEILDAFVVRYVGPSVLQAGDPLERHVFHCSKKKPTVLLFSGESNSGKTYVSSLLARRADASRFDHDHVLGIIARDEFGSRNSLVKRIARDYDLAKIYRLVDTLVKEGLGEEYGKLLAKYVPSENELAVAEGYAFLHEPVRKAFVDALTQRGFVVWLSERLG